MNTIAFARRTVRRHASRLSTSFCTLALLAAIGLGAGCGDGDPCSYGGAIPCPGAEQGSSNEGSSDQGSTTDDSGSSCDEECVNSCLDESNSCEQTCLDVASTIIEAGAYPSSCDYCGSLSDCSSNCGCGN
jgi:hypothetical protein